MDTNIVQNIGTNTHYITRYIKSHYVQKKIRRDLYEAFIKWCGEESINVCLEKALRIFGTNIGTNTVPNIVTNIGENIGTNSVQKENPQISVPNIGTNIVTDKKTVVKCIEKSKVRSVKGFVDHLNRKGVLVDWWEDIDDYCFELKS